jgi:hypothetical protein
MMHISPCAWYCFTLGDDPQEWEVEDQKDRTVLTAADQSCVIELAAARKAAATDDGEVAEIHERYLKDEGIQAVKTLMSENPHRIVTYVTRGLGSDEREHIICHAYWKNYCAFIKYQGRRNGDTHNRVQAFYDLVQSLQPLAME